MDWFLYDTGLRHERVKLTISVIGRSEMIEIKLERGEG